MRFKSWWKTCTGADHYVMEIFGDAISDGSYEFMAE